MVLLMNCRRCNTPMKPGQFIRQTWNKLRPGQLVGSQYASGPGKLDTCLKCPSCGHSVTKEKADD